jgi:glycosyl transferase family 25
MSHYIDHIFYINLDSRTDRCEEFENQMKEYGFEYERFSAICEPQNGALGCTKSHLAVLRLAKERNYHRVLVFEDDFMFTVSPGTVQEQLSQLLDTPVPFDICFLSYNVLVSEETSYSFLRRAIETQTSSGYIIERHYYDRLIENFESSVYGFEHRTHGNHALDIEWKRLQPIDRWYYFITRLGIQRPGYSDIDKKIVSYGV